jgi:DNA helicase-2/ATP-dependent DNA helicase PcrA
LFPGFTLLDREDSADLIDQIRQQQGLAHTRERFPRKGTCLAIYSRVVNTQAPLRACLEEAFPWCLTWEEPLHGLFAAYVEAKATRQVLDYDDLLLYWYHLLGEPSLAARVGAMFSHVLVDEYQDTNAIQAEILARMRPDGRGVTVVGDDAQAIYSFRAATIHNILSFPQRYQPPAAVLALERNYRSTQPILAAANGVIALSPQRHAKELYSARGGGPRPRLVTVDDELAQVDHVVERILERREAGVPLRQQSVLFRAAHHSDLLEVELGRRNIPFVKYGGLRFLEAAHVKDTLAVLRWAENPRDGLAGFRVVQLLPGVGPQTAGRLSESVANAAAALPDSLAAFTPSGRHPRGLARPGGALPAAVRSGHALGRAAGPDPRLVPAPPRAHPRRRPRPSGRSRTAGAAGLGVRLARALPVRPGPRSARGHRGRGRPAPPRRGLPDPVDRTLGQGAGVGHGVRAQRG